MTKNILNSWQYDYQKNQNHVVKYFTHKDIQYIA